MELYNLEVSPPCRAIRVLAKELNLELKLTEVNLMAGEQYSEEYLELNPFHKIPVLKDGDFVLFDSHAILMYLANKYAPDNQLYPKEPQQRALVDAMLNYNSSTFQQGLSCFVTSVLRKKQVPTQEIKDTAQENFKNLNKLLEKRKFAAGDNLSIADIAIIHSFVYAEVMNVSLEEYPNVINYVDRVKQSLKFFKEINSKATETFKALMTSKLVELSAQ